MIKSLQRVSGCLNTAARVQILNAFIMPHVKYCSTVWGNGSTATANSMGKILQRFARIVLHDANAILNSSTNSATGIRPYAILNSSTNSATGIRSFQKLVFIQNVMRLRTALNDGTYTLFVHVPLSSNISQRCTRGTEGQKFAPDIYKRVMDQSGFHCKAIRNWNSLLSSLTTMPNLSSFYTPIIAFIDKEN